MRDDSTGSLAFLWQGVGRTLASHTIRIHLAGRLTVDVNGTRIEQQAFPGQQGRLAFAYLVTERSRPVARSELAEVLWPTTLAPSWDAALSAIVSKIRTLLARAGLDGATVLTSAAGCYDLRLPGTVWLDVEAAAEGIHDAEVALRADDPRSAYGPSAIAHHIARRAFLPGDTPWAEGRREKLRGILMRALECRATVYLWNREFSLAVEAAKDVVALEPFRETGHQLLMRAHAAAGNSAEALWAYERCRKLLSEELGVDPSRQTRAIHDEVLRSASA